MSDDAGSPRIRRQPKATLARSAWIDNDLYCRRLPRVEDDAVYDASPIAEEAICLALVVLMLSGDRGGGWRR